MAQPYGLRASRMRKLASQERRHARRAFAKSACAADDRAAARFQREADYACLTAELHGAVADHFEWIDAATDVLTIEQAGLQARRLGASHRTSSLHPVHPS